MKSGRTSVSRSAQRLWQCSRVSQRCFGASTLQAQRESLALRSEYGQWINNCEVMSESTMPVLDPSTNEPLTKIGVASHSEVNSAVLGAKQAFDSGVWSRSDVRERSEVLSRAAGLLKSHVEDIARLESAQTGRPIREMTAQLGRLPEWLDYYASLIRVHEGTMPPFKGSFVNYVRRLPLGVAAQMTAWNHPMLLAIKKVAPALATGNSVVIKPSEQAPCSVLEFARLMKEAGLPSGVLQVITGDGPGTGHSLVTHELIDKIDLTGGLSTFTAIQKARVQSTDKMTHYTAELGGKAPMIVFEDCQRRTIGDGRKCALQQTVDGCVFGTFIASGQTCIMGGRLLIERSIFDQMLSMLVSKVESSVTMGPPSWMSTRLGPVISAQSKDALISQLNEYGNRDGAKIVTGGRSPSESECASMNINPKGNWVMPTVVDLSGVSDLSQHYIAQEELFGPIVAVIPFEDECDAIRIANECRYGLAASIWTSDVSRAHRVSEQLNAGIIWVNDHHKNDPCSQFGGFKQSGIGRENGLDALNEYTQAKSVIVSYNDDPFDWFVKDDTTRVRYG